MADQTGAQAQGMRPRRMFCVARSASSDGQEASLRDPTTITAGAPWKRKPAAGRGHVFNAFNPWGTVAWYR